MNEPTEIGKLVGPPPPVLRIPKRCLPSPRGCGKEYEGNSLTPLKPGEERRVWPCDDCLERADTQARMEKVAEERAKSRPVEDLRRPERTRRDWE